MNYAKNMNGIDVSYTDEFAQDLLAVHNLHVDILIENMYGIEIHIEKTLVGIRYGHCVLEFTLSTNDIRDEPFKWTIIPK